MAVPDKTFHTPNLQREMHIDAQHATTANIFGNLARPTMHYAQFRHTIRVAEASGCLGMLADAVRSKDSIQECCYGGTPK